MVGVVRAPSERKLAEIACSAHYRIVGICNVHQNLRALSCLYVFIRDILNRAVVSDVGKMGKASLFYIYFLKCDAKRFHERNRIVVCSARCAKARHCNTDDIRNRSAKFFHCLNAHKQSERRIKAAGNTYNNILRCYGHPFYKTCNLHFKN